MKRLVVAAIVLCSTSAFAGGYIGLGIGPGEASSGDLSLSPDGRTGRLLGGFSFGKLAAEASIGQASLVQTNTQPYTTTQLAISGKYSYPLGDGFEVFGRLGLHQTSLSATGRTDLNVDGSGILFGGGAEYRSKLPVSFWVDYTITHATLTGPTFPDTDLTTRQWMIGASLGI